MTRRSTIGFDRRLHIEWLDAAAAQAANGVESEGVRDYLWKLLDGVVSGDKSNSARGKTVTVLNHIWGDVPQKAVGLRNRAATQLVDASEVERLALHWAMMVGTYPVFTDIAASTGRLLKLQGTFSQAQLTRRLVRVWGERSTLLRAIQRIIRSMIDWGVLQDTETRGIYEQTSPRSINTPEVATLLVEALLVDAEEDSLALEGLVSHPALFPFELELRPSSLRKKNHLQVHRQGLDADFVELVGEG